MSDVRKTTKDNEQQLFLDASGGEEPDNHQLPRVSGSLAHPLAQSVYGTVRRALLVREPLLPLLPVRHLDVSS